MRAPEPGLARQYPSTETHMNQAELGFSLVTGFQGNN